nr:hypothetical protein [Kibdelosporangium sp. MJ126-NF4]
MRRALLGLTAAIVTTCVGCTASPVLPGPVATSLRGKSDVKVRFVVLLTPDGKPIDITAGEHAMPREGASGLKSGSVTDYVEFPTRSLSVVAHEGGALLQNIDIFSDSSDAARYTVVLGVSDGDVEAIGFKERDGKVAMQQLPVEAPADKAVLFSTSAGIQPGSGPKDPFPSLGAGVAKCFTTEPNLGTDFLKTLSLSTTSSHYYIAVDPGEHDLAWYSKKQKYADEKCAQPITGNGKINLAAGQHAYVLPWLADPTHFEAMIVPVTADGKGDAGVVNLPTGPAYQVD